MDISVIGYKGVVGGATYELLSRLGHNVWGIEKGDNPVPCDIAFVCIPEEAITPETLVKFRPRLFVVRSTVVPYTCELLQDTLGIHVLHNPEFLREATAVVDEFSPDRIVIGECCPEHGDLVFQLYEPLCCPVVRTSRVVSELTKLACNGYLATVISYWNEIDRIARAFSVSGTEVGMLASLDSRISPYGSRYHRKFGGKCLPKDTRHLIYLAHNLGLNPALLEAVIKINEEVV